MRSKKFFIISNLIAALWSVTVLGICHITTSRQKQVLTTPEHTPSQHIHLVSGPPTQPQTFAVPNFIDAAKKATPSVVHITAKYDLKVGREGIRQNPLEQLLREFFGEELELQPKERSHPGTTAGSGVLIAEDGYIVTNNHVIAGVDQIADHIEVTLDDNRRYTAKIVGTDPDTDLALIKIEAKGLAYLQFGNSDALQIGEWVLAVGNPFSLTSTVTQGIVSAKARRTDMLARGTKIESFIQIDAAVNRGNSGGALVNLNGELVGINTAIVAPTGTFAGYAFAIPSAIVERIVHDLKKRGFVQRAVLGVTVEDVNADLATDKKLRRFEGVYIQSVTANSAADKAGLKEGDVIIAVNGNKIKNVPQLNEHLARYQPNDTVSVTFDRKGKEDTVQVILRNALKETEIIRRQHVVEVGGATFEAPDQLLLKKLSITGGVQIKALKTGKWQQAGIKKGFIILAIDHKQVENLDQFFDILNNQKGGMLVEGIYPNGERAYYGLGWNK